jgi:hypothetical protein
VRLEKPVTPGSVCPGRKSEHRTLGLSPRRRRRQVQSLGSVSHGASARRRAKLELAQLKSLRHAAGLCISPRRRLGAAAEARVHMSESSRPPGEHIET